MVDTAGVPDPSPMIDAEPSAGEVAERLLVRAVDPRGDTALAWAAGPLLDAGRVLDLCCGHGPLADVLAPGRWLGVDPVGGPRRPRLRGLPTAVPLRSGAVDGICLMLTLPRLSDLDIVFAELRRVLRPGGTLVALVPSAMARSLAELRLAPVHRTGWLNRSALDHAGWLLAAADFAVLGDDRRVFGLPLPDAVAAHALVADLSRSGLWPASLPEPTHARVTQRLTTYAGPGRVLPLPLRRLVARR